MTEGQKDKSSTGLYWLLNPDNMTYQIKIVMQIAVLLVPVYMSS